MNTHYISAEHLTIDHVGEIMTHDYRLALSDDARARIVRCREYLDHKIETTERPIYGVTTGFGSLCNVSVQPDELSQLQINLMMSHSLAERATVCPTKLCGSCCCSKSSR